MNARDQATFDAGIRAAIQMAQVSALALEIGDDARDLRHRTAAAALQALAEGLRAGFLDKPSPAPSV